MNPAFGRSQGVIQTDSSQTFSCVWNEQAEVAWALRDVHGSLCAFHAGEMPAQECLPGTNRWPT